MGTNLSEKFIDMKKILCAMDQRPDNKNSFFTVNVLGLWVFESVTQDEESKKIKMELSSKENLYEFASLIVKNLTFDI